MPLSNMLCIPHQQFSIKSEKFSPTQLCVPLHDFSNVCSTKRGQLERLSFEMQMFCGNSIWTLESSNWFYTKMMPWKLERTKLRTGPLQTLECRRPSVVVRLEFCRIHCSPLLWKSMRAAGDGSDVKNYAPAHFHLFCNIWRQWICFKHIITQMSWLVGWAAWKPFLFFCIF